MKKLVIITGGTKGIGKALVHKFASRNFDVVTCSRNAKELEVLKRSVEELFPEVKVHICVADLSQKEGRERMIAFIQNMKKPIHVLINNTGVFVQGQIFNEPEGVLEQQLQTNVLSAYDITRGVIPGMLEQKKGSVFNICSTASIVPYTNGGSYCISKYALLGMTKVLREEMKPYNIKVTAVLPGATLTSSWEGVDLPAERFMKPEDVADSIMAVYELSDHTVVEELLLRPLLGDIG